MKSVSMQIWPPNVNLLCGQTALSWLQWEKQKKIDFPVDCFARIEFDLSLETGDKCILVFKITFVRVWFFDQSEFEKKSNSINRLFRHWNRLTSEHSLQWNDFLMREFVVSMEKRSTIFSGLMSFSLYMIRYWKEKNAQRITNNRWVWHISS